MIFLFACESVRGTADVLSSLLWEGVRRQASVASDKFIASISYPICAQFARLWKMKCREKVESEDVQIS